MLKLDRDVVSRRLFGFPAFCRRRDRHEDLRQISVLSFRRLNQAVTRLGDLRAVISKFNDLTRLLSQASKTAVVFNFNDLNRLQLFPL